MASTVTAFLDDREIASGEREAVTRMLEQQHPQRQSEILVFEDDTGRVTDLDYGGFTAAAPRAAGRPKLGVQAREVTLLPRHWEWLSTQPGGASAALRRLVEEARRKGRSQRERQDAAYRFMQAMCGDRPGYEEALRSLYKSDAAGFSAEIAAWPEDLKAYVGRLLAAPD
jgi:hypothetical protein